MLGSRRPQRKSPEVAGTAQVVMLHLKRVHLMEWVRAVMAVALGVAPHAPLPPLIMQHEQPDIWTQPSVPAAAMLSDHAEAPA